MKQKRRCGLWMTAAAALATLGPSDFIAGNTLTLRDQAGRPLWASRRGRTK